MWDPAGRDVSDNEAGVSGSKSGIPSNDAGVGGLVDPSAKTGTDRLQGFGDGTYSQTTHMAGVMSRHQDQPGIDQHPRHGSWGGLIDTSQLLGRDQIRADRAMLSDSVRGRSLLITGAGGSIGSGLCRTLANHRPRRIVLVERSEVALHEVSLLLADLQRRQPEAGGMEVVQCLADCGDRPRMTSIMREI